VQSLMNCVWPANSEMVKVYQSTFATPVKDFGSQDALSGYSLPQIYRHRSLAARGYDRRILAAFFAWASDANIPIPYGEVSVVLYLRRNRDENSIPAFLLDPFYSSKC
jgi:hypothetical protein